jgi:hypothetical protein
MTTVAKTQISGDPPLRETAGREPGSVTEPMVSTPRTGRTRALDPGDLRRRGLERLTRSELTEPTDDSGADAPRLPLLPAGTADGIRDHFRETS